MCKLLLRRTMSGGMQSFHSWRANSTTTNSCNSVTKHSEPLGWRLLLEIIHPLRKASRGREGTLICYPIV